MRIPTLAALCALWVLASPTPALAQLDSPKSIDELERQTAKKKKKAPPPEDEATTTDEAADTTEAEPPPGAKHGRKAKRPATGLADTTEEDSPEAEEPAEHSSTDHSKTAKTGAAAKASDTVPAAANSDAKPGGAKGGETKPAEASAPSSASGSGAATTTRAPAKALLVPKLSDADLEALWARWRKATAELDVKTADSTQAELIRAKEDLGITDLEGFSVGFLRAAATRQKANDPSGAVALATAAKQLAPHLPYARLGLADAYFFAEPTSVGRVVDELKSALLVLARDPRYLRPALADLGSAALFALLATAVTVALVMFVRKARYFMHDFHHLFPRGTARWQSSAIAILVLLLPWVFHLGIAATLLVLLLPVSLYLSTVERVVAGVLVALLAVVPLLAAELVERTAFAGTIAEDVYELEHGGIEAHAAAQRVIARHAEGHAGFAELFALGRYETRRGDYDHGMDHLKAAASKKNNDARLLVNLGNAMLAKGDPDGAMDIYKSATQNDASLAAGFFNLSKIHYRRASTLPDEAVGLELDKAHVALQSAQRLDESLLLREDPPDDNLQVNRLLLSPTLTREELLELAAPGESGEKVRSQLSLSLVGTSSPLFGMAYPVVGALLIFAFGFASRRLFAARSCDKCGRAVCRRCDPELGVGSLMCGQCVNVFARKGVVAAPLKVRKQAEVDRHHARMDRLSYVFGMLCSGAGHLFSGLPVRGALYAFVFLFVAFSAFFRQGILRAPYGAVPVVLQLVPLGLVFLAVYLLSLRGLYKRQAEG